MGELLLAPMLILWPLVLVIAIVWIILPFAIFGTKPILREIAKQLSEINHIMAVQRGHPDTHFQCPYCREPVRNDAIKCKHCLSAVTAPPLSPEEPRKRIFGRK